MGRASPPHTSTAPEGSGWRATRRHGEPACARRRGAAALLLWVGSRERATLLPKRVNHRSDLLILTISLSDAPKRRLHLAPKESTPLPGEGRLLFLSPWGTNFAVTVCPYPRARRRMPCRTRVPPAAGRAAAPDALIAWDGAQALLLQGSSPESDWVALSILFYFISDLLLHTDSELNAFTPSALLLFLCRLLK